ncbi:MAG: ANTAR domain-containing protein [Armatimonadota bacterium]|nr:ANTAR domain-containing protein [Armatimonadota bacterium]
MATNRILIASPFAEDRRLLRRVLERAGIEVAAEIEDGEAAIEQARNIRPDAVLLHHSYSPRPPTPSPKNRRGGVAAETDSDSLPVSPMDGLSIARVLSTEKLAAPLLILDSEAVVEAELFADAAVFGCVVKPFVEAQVVSAVLIAIGQRRERVRLAAEIEAAIEKLEVRKLIDRAKGLLIEAHGLNETEAFRRLQTQSMNTRQSMKEVAQAVIVSYLERR